MNVVSNLSNQPNSKILIIAVIIGIVLIILDNVIDEDNSSLKIAGASCLGVAVCELAGFVLPFLVYGAYLFTVIAAIFIIIGIFQMIFNH